MASRGRAWEATLSPGQVWTLDEILQEFPDAFLYVSPAKGAREVLVVVPRAAGSISPTRDATSTVMVWSQRIRAIRPQDPEKPLVRASVAFLALGPQEDPPLETWDPMTGKSRDRLGL